MSGTASASEPPCALIFQSWRKDEKPQRRTGIILPRTESRKVGVRSPLHGLDDRRLVNVEGIAPATSLGRVPPAPVRALARVERLGVIRQAHRGPALAVVGHPGDGVPLRGGGGEAPFDRVVGLTGQADRQRTRRDKVGPAALVCRGKVRRKWSEPFMGLLVAKSLQRREREKKRTSPVRIGEEFRARRR